jgi:hypothetical protein
MRLAGSSVLPHHRTRASRMRAHRTVAKWTRGLRWRLRRPEWPDAEPAQGRFSTAVLLGDPAIGINDSAPDPRATAHRQTTQARIRPLPCRELFRADAPAPHHHDLGRAGRLGPVPGRA